MHIYLCERNCVFLYLLISDLVCMSWCENFCSLRRINQASATWPHWLWPYWAQLIRVPCGPDMRRTKKQEEWKEAEDRRTSRQWMIMVTRTILLALPPPTETLALALALACTWMSELAQVSVGEVSQPRRVWSVSCWGWQEGKRGVRNRRDVQ